MPNHAFEQELEYIRKRFTYIQQAFVYWCCHGQINRFIGIIEKEIVKKQERKKKKIHVT